MPTVTLPPSRESAATPSHLNSRHRGSQKWIAGLVIAAGLLIAVSLNWLRPNTPSVHAGEFSQQLTVVPGEVLRLLTRAAETSQTRVPQLSPLANLSVPDVSAWKNQAIAELELPVRQEFVTWQAGWLDLKSRFSSTSNEL